MRTNLTATRLILATASLGLALGASAQEIGRRGGVTGHADLPPNAKPGECFARVYVPPRFVTETDDVLKNEATERVEIIPARYETVTEDILVKPARTKLVKVPARYEWAEETMMVAPARTEWKKGPCDPKRQLDNATGECLCLVEIPPRYKTMRQKMQVAPPSTREVAIPAEYKTIKKTVLVSPASERRIAVPATYTTVKRQVQVSEAHMKWQLIDCKYGAPLYDRDTTMALQRSLKAKGFDPGPIDGIFGPLTRTALQTFQDSKNWPHEGLAARTREALGMPVGSKS